MDKAELIRRLMATFQLELQERVRSHDENEVGVGVAGAERPQRVGGVDEAALDLDAGHGEPKVVVDREEVPGVGRCGEIPAVRGEARLVIVYATDALVSTRARLVDTFPADSHPPISYPVALLGNGTDAPAAAFYRFLLSAEGTALFLRRGFTAVR